MPLQARELDQRIDKLRKSLKQFPKDPTPEEVHDLRTRTRRVESILQALEMNSSGKQHKLLDGLSVVRKRSGRVRDMDVFTADVIGLDVKKDQACQIRLL